MAALTQSTDPTKKAHIVEAVTPEIRDFHHQDAMFGNSFPPKSHFIIYPDWISEGVNPPRSQPLERPAWAWEQPRHRQNVQFPTTYVTPKYTKTPPVQMQPIPYKLQIGYRPTQVEVTRKVHGVMTYGQPIMEERRNEKPECFTRHKTEEEPLMFEPMTTKAERERIQWHLHY